MNERCQLQSRSACRRKHRYIGIKSARTPWGASSSIIVSRPAVCTATSKQGWAEPGALSIRVRTWTSIVSARTLELPNCPEPDHKCMMRRVYLGLEAPRCLHVPAVAWSRQPVQTWRGAPPVDLASPSICSFGSLYYRYTATLSRLICLWTLQRTP